MMTLARYIGILALTVSFGCAQEESLDEDDFDYDTQYIVSSILGVGFYTGPDLDVPMEDGNEISIRVLQQQVTFAPGGDATPWHTHPGHVIIQVLEGELTLETEVRCETYSVGEVFIEYPDELNRVVNTFDGQSKTHATHISKSDRPFGAGHAPPESGGACGF